MAPSRPRQQHWPQPITALPAFAAEMSVQSRASYPGPATNHLCVWIHGRGEQPMRRLSGPRGEPVGPMSGVSGCAEGASVCRGPMSASVPPAGAGDWW